VAVGFIFYGIGFLSKLKDWYRIICRLSLKTASLSNLNRNISPDSLFLVIINIEK
jgi:hypothetical protein